MAIAAATPTQVSVPDQAFWKITLRLMPYLALLWCLAWIDRVNIGFAKLTMLDDLKFSEAVYGLGAGMFFLPETPRWLIRGGHHEVAHRVLVRIRDVADVNVEIEEIKASLEQQTENAASGVFCFD